MKNMDGADWRKSFIPARLGSTLADNVVQCNLSPRRCIIKPGQRGFCGVRGNIDGKLVTFNFGKSVHATEECIETEAVFHYAPGEPILSMGNIGCMLNCDYCHNWKTSQAKHVSSKDVWEYTPEEVVALAKAHNIRVISWTYNDPVVWHEFILKTAELAKKEGMINLYKSAFYITPEAVEELLPVIDIFSISIKSMDPQYYKRLTKGTLEPVLAAVQQVKNAKKHVEVSTLMVTNLSDDSNTATNVADFVLSKLGAETPLHFVRFHPDYKMVQTIRTPLDRLYRARDIALAKGVKHVYLGNVYDDTANNTCCLKCGSTLVSRYGLIAEAHGLDSSCNCRKCGTKSHIILLPERKASPRVAAQDFADIIKREYFWRGDIRSLHLELENTESQPRSIVVEPIVPGEKHADARVRNIVIGPGSRHRVLVAKSSAEEIGITIALPRSTNTVLYDVFDRAHFPTVDTTAGTLNADISPLPQWRSA